jgi:isochorismate synthase EntC
VNKTKFNEQQWIQSGAILSTRDDSLDVAFGACQICETVDSQQTRWFSPSDFQNLSPSDFFLFEHNEQIARAELMQNIGQGEQPKLNWKPADSTLFAEHFSSVQKSIAVGEVQKVVPYVFERSNLELKAGHIRYFLHRLLSSQTHGHIFGHWDLAAGKAVLGLTPEILFRTSSDELFQTMALAGTAASDGHSLLQDSKEIAEHQLVIAGLEDSLAEFGSRLNKGDTFEWQVGALKHLRTDLEMKLKQTNSLSLLQALHPTPALGGYPKSRSLELLGRFQLDLPRGSFGAPFGLERSFAESLFVVQIRCLIFNNSEVLLGSGCGVVKDSELSKEWAELERKRQSVKKVFGLI